MDHFSLVASPGLSGLIPKLLLKSQKQGKSKDPDVEGWGGYSQTLKLILCLYDVSDTVLNIYVVSPTPAPFSRNTTIIPSHPYEETEALRSSHSLHYLSVISTGQVNYFYVCMCNVCSV